LGHFAPSTRATGKRNQGQALIFGHPLANYGTVTDRQRKDPGHAVRGHDAIGEVLYGHGGQRHQL
jgi:hypothetical protein